MMARPARVAPAWARRAPPRWAVALAAVLLPLVAASLLLCLKTAALLGDDVQPLLSNPSAAEDFARL